jgi:hypothetical protein
VPAEASMSALNDFLFVDAAGNTFSSSIEKSSITTLLEEKIVRDFAESRTVIVDGWVLSVTEARQCAAYSISQAQ